MSNDSPSQSPFQQLSDLVQKYEKPQKNKYIGHEFQMYGLRLAEELNDFAHKSLYIRLAKNVERGILERARSFVSDANARSKAKLFMWKLKELLAAYKEKQKNKPKDEQTSLFDE